MRVRPLLNRRQLAPGESLSSLWVRLQRVNYYKNPSAIADICRPYLSPGESIHLPCTAATWSAVAELTRLPAADLYRATLHHYAAALALPEEKPEQVRLPDGVWKPLATARMRQFTWRSLRDAQYCPLCLADGRYHRRRWLNLLVAVCPHHECLLQRGCSCCGQKLTVAAVVDGYCPTCDHDLATAPVLTLDQDSWGLEAHRFLQAGWGDCPDPLLPEGKTLPDQPFPVLLEVLRGLAPAVARLAVGMLPAAPGLVDPRPKPRETPTPGQVYATYATALKVLSHWPQGFHDFLHAVRQRPGVVEGQVTSEFDSLYLVWLEDRWQAPEFSFIQAAFDNYLVANYALSRSITRLARYRRSRNFRDRFPYLTYKEAAERLAVEPEIVQRLVDAALLVDYERGEGRQRHWHQRLRIVRRAELVDLQSRWQEGIPLPVVAEILAVDRPVVEDLVRAKILTRSGSTGEDDSDGERIEKNSLNALVRSLCTAPALPHDFADYQPLWKLVQAGHDLIQILQGILAGEVTVIWRDEGLLFVQVSHAAGQQSES